MGLRDIILHGDSYFYFPNKHELSHSSALVDIDLSKPSPTLPTRHLDLALNRALDDEP
jgi:hypothetical protein